jgi:hypothetical protein
MEANMNNLVKKLSWQTCASFCLLWIVSAALPVKAALNADEQSAYQAVAEELSAINGEVYSVEDLEPQTYWIDSTNGVDDYSRTGAISQPWKSIVWAMNNIPFEEDEANIIIREGTYTPEILYFSQQRGGDSSSSTPFNLLAYPGETVVISGSNMGNNGAIVSISGAENITISGIEFSNVRGSGKSVIYISYSTETNTHSDKIRIINNTITNAKWTDNPEDAESPNLADRLNGITIVGGSTNTMIKNNNLNNLVTGYGEPILVLDSPSTILSGNTISDIDPSTFTGQRYFVSPGGSDVTGIGTKDRPWKTIHQALEDIPFDEDDATVIVRGGNYVIPKAIFFEEKRSGSEGKYFTIRAYKDEEVIIDGSLIKTDGAMIAFSSASFIRIKGLTLANLKGNKSGIYMAGTSHHIRIIDNSLRDMTWVVDETSEDPQYPDAGNNLNPIAVIGNHPTQAIHNIVIRGNELSNIVPGWSEGIKIVGNVTDFVVAKNHIHHIANIGIVAAGNYPWVKIPAEVNHARNGVIRDNIVHHAVSPVANSAGIYLDGARNVLVRGNTSYNNGVGFSVGSEQAGDATGNTLRRNIAYDNFDAGLVVGTADANVVAVVKDTTVVKNEFRNNYTRGGYGGEMTIQSVNGLKVNNNLFSSRSDIMIVASQPSTRLSLDNNLYHGISNTSDKAIFDWSQIDGASYQSLSDYQAGTCNDLRGVYQDASTIQLVDGLRTKSKPKNRVGKELLSKIKRACYRGKKVW